MNSSSITTSTMYLTTNTGTVDPEGKDKYIRVDLKDDAGNITVLTPVVIKYNTTAATLEITFISHDRVSCEYVLRKKTEAGAVVDDTDYASLMLFSVESNQDIVQWKVAAYKSSSAPDHPYPSPETSGESITPMTKVTGSHSSTGYTGTIAQSTVDKKHWDVIVDGLDYRNALGGSASTNIDGTYWVVVFAQNKAGIWSVAGTPVA